MNKYTKEELEKYILEEGLSYEAIGRIYGVTGNAIKKAAVRRGIELPKKRKINVNENFSHPGKSKIDKLSDAEFIQIIKDNVGWKNIGIACGYSTKSRNPSSDIMEKIKSRCSKLGIEPTIYKPISLLSRTKG